MEKAEKTESIANKIFFFKKKSNNFYLNLPIIFFFNIHNFLNFILSYFIIILLTQSQLNRANVWDTPVSTPFWHTPLLSGIFRSPILLFGTTGTMVQLRYYYLVQLVVPSNTIVQLGIIWYNYKEIVQLGITWYNNEYMVQLR